MDIGKRYLERVDQVKFCYGKTGGKGFVEKATCQCTAENPCQSKIDHTRYHELMSTVTYGDYKGRDRRIQEIKSQFVGSQWWKDNVKD